MSPGPDQFTEVLHPDVARFPRARLTVVKGPDKGVEVVLEGQTVVVGSDESCQLKLSDASVSPTPTLERSNARLSITSNASPSPGRLVIGSQAQMHLGI